jgi:hypothetical protein
MGVSPQLLYFCERLSGFSTNYFKLESAQTLASSSSIVSFDMPSNALLNLESFTIHFNADANVVGGMGARLPPVRDLIERCEVSCGGVILSQGNNFVNVLTEAKAALTGEVSDFATGNALLVLKGDNNLGEGGYIQTGNQVTSGPPGTTMYQVHAHELPGFLQTVQPRIFDTSIIPDLRVRLYMASDNVLATCDSADFASTITQLNYDENDTVTGYPKGPRVTGAKYRVYDIHATIECISLADMSYENVLASTMASQGFLEAPFKAYHTFLDTHTGSSRFSIAAQSMDRVWLAWRASTYNSQDNPVGVMHEQTPHWFKSTLWQDQNAVGRSRYFNFSEPLLVKKVRRETDSNGVDLAHQDRFHVDYPVVSDNTWKCQLQLNGAYMPQYSATVTELYNISMNSIEGRKKRSMSLPAYRLNNCVQCFRLNMPDSEFSRTLSGLDTRAVNLAGYVRTEGAYPGANLMIFVETTSTLRIGAGRAIELIA